MRSSVEKPAGSRRRALQIQLSGSFVAGEEQHRNVDSGLGKYSLFEGAVALVTVEYEDEVPDLSELPERGRVHRELVRSGVTAYANGFPLDPLARQENVEHTLQDALRGRVLAEGG